MRPRLLPFGLAVLACGTGGAPTPRAVAPTSARDAPDAPRSAVPRGGEDESPPGEGEGAAPAAEGDEPIAGAPPSGEGCACWSPKPECELAVEPPRAAPPVLAALDLETWIFPTPDHRYRPLGYLRAGAIVPRAPCPSGFAGCPDGWYEIEPRGFVCAGERATLDVGHPLVAAHAQRPRRDALPYPYVTSLDPPPLLFRRLPTAAEQREHEPMPPARTHGRPRRIHGGEPRSEELLPAALAATLLAPRREVPLRVDDGEVVLRAAHARSAFALLATVAQEGRLFGWTPDQELLPLDRTRPVTPSTFSGVVLGPTDPLPLAFVTARRAVRFRGDSLKPAARLAFRETIPLTGRRREARSGGYLEVRGAGGAWVREADVSVAEAPAPWPPWAKGRVRWIDISVERQTLVAFEGRTAVFATLVSTGKDGLRDPRTHYSTVLGVYHVREKHVTRTMDREDPDAEDGRDPAEPFEYRDVPFVQFFHHGYALHGAYWHDGFGTPRSHGCVNLAVADAAWLFSWTTPEVPEGWHGAFAKPAGTIVRTRR